MALGVDQILQLPRFSANLHAAVVQSVLRSLPEISGGQSEGSIDWNYLLMCASALTSANAESAQECVLRIAQGCLLNDLSDDLQKSAALLLLERVGNQPSIALAHERGLTPSVAVEANPILVLDAASRAQTLQVTDRAGETRAVSPFQKDFWDEVEQNDWVSISAPTSAGKSFILRLWIRDELTKGNNVRIVYIAPTRALVEEVGAALRSMLPMTVGVHTLPWDPEVASFDRQVFVLTQERLHLLHHRLPSFHADIMFVDEAQKIAEGTRGILLSQVIDEAISRNPLTKLLFASPLSENPGVLLESAPPDRRASALIGESVAVSQNLLSVKQVFRSPGDYSITLKYRGSDIALGTFPLSRSANGVGEKLPLVAVALGGSAGGNLIYANGPADAEKFARTIYDELGDSADLDDPIIDDLIAFSEGVVHKRFLLGEVARRGVAFHYGDMPLVLKAKVEAAFKAGSIRFLVSTSTLLEGVNLPCRSIFIRAPKKGPDKMSTADFWNLSGRAGRWGLEFQGNIICIDTDDEVAWPTPPGERARSLIAPAAVDVLRDEAALLSYIQLAAPKSTTAATARLESTFNWLAGSFIADGEFRKPYGVSLSVSQQRRLTVALRESTSTLAISSHLVNKHAGISPLSMQRLYAFMLEHGRPDLLALVPPTSDEAFSEYKAALDLIAEYLGGSFEPDTRRFSLARLVVQWMRGMPLSVMIDNRAKYRRDRSINFSYPKLIRDVMKDVETIARFEAPKYLACYADLVRAAAEEIGSTSMPDAVDIDMMLELGVPRITDMSLISLGLSRSTTMAISRYLTAPDLTPSACADWIDESDPESLDAPVFAIRELAQLRAVRSARADFEIDDSYTA